MSSDDDTPTTRTFPRSTREAFPDRAAIERPRKREHGGLVFLACIAVALLMLALAAA